MYLGFVAARRTKDALVEGGKKAACVATNAAMFCRIPTGTSAYVSGATAFFADGAARSSGWTMGDVWLSISKSGRTLCFLMVLCLTSTTRR